MEGVKIDTTLDAGRADAMERVKDNDDKKIQENSPLYSKMSWTTHSLIFLYACAFWIQVGVFPV